MCFHYVHVWSSNSFFLCAVALFSAGPGSFPFSSPVSSTVILLNPERVLLHQLHTLKPTHGPIAEAIKLSTSLSPFAGASSSSPQMFSPSCFPPKFFIAPSPFSPLLLSSLPYSCGVRFVVSRAAGKRSQMLT